MISNIWNWIKNIFKSEKQDPHLVLYEEAQEPKPEHCVKHSRFKKSCPDCKEIIA
jgi:primosomal protein N'